MKYINKIHEQVVELLKEDEELRKNDLLLMTRVYSELLGKDASRLSFKTICTLIEKKQIPTFDTIRRVRCKAQELFPELIDGPTQMKRKGKMKDYIEFSRKTTY